jgi:hypothetical protein
MHSFIENCHVFLPVSYSLRYDFSILPTKVSEITESTASLAPVAFGNIGYQLVIGKP